LVLRISFLRQFLSVKLGAEAERGGEPQNTLNTQKGTEKEWPQRGAEGAKKGNI
jgi:hypothetical protein